MKFNEDTRVKIPTLIHLTRLGYKYISLKNNQWDVNTNIFTDIFKRSLKKINPKVTEHELDNLYKEISLCLDNEDLGRKFFEKILSKSGIKIIDFENTENNSFNVVTELPYKKDDEEFRPDITLLINGIPLVFIEVKKPNNKDGMLAERKRIQTRFKNKKFKKFINITQLIIFSNNMNYDDSSLQQLEGAFYATTSNKNVIFNHFREEENINFENILEKISDEVENEILVDNNLQSIKKKIELQTNKDPNTPTNKICTSLLSIDRLLFLLEFGIVYVKGVNDLQKHIMRYPQFFATKQIKDKIESGIKSGIIWHTQGSGKTALAYFSLKYLSEYFRKKKIIPKFYFIVDRIDLLKQASKEFKSRGLSVYNIDSKENFSRDIRSNVAIHNSTGNDEITVVNIQKFENDNDTILENDYNVNIQKIFFLDEVHRSYNPTGSFLANLHLADKKAIKIGLTGTPLLGDNNSRSLFGNYIHKYFYNQSIADGYTLRLIREGIETQYRMSLQQTLDQIKILKGDIDKRDLYSDPKFVEPMIDYIVKDFEKSRISMNDNTIGAMVVCDSYKQAETMYKIFQNSQKKIDKNKNEINNKKETYVSEITRLSKVKSAELVLYDTGTKEDRDQIVDNFKEGKIDLLFVYNMLLTGFDSSRLKKIYLGRKIKSHNLLQTLTRVNRTYNEFRYGYVVDFVDIEKEFDKTNRAYFDELQLELGDEFENYENMFKSEKEIENEINEIKSLLFKYDTTNLENFSKQISQINDKKDVREIVKILNNARELYNIIRLSGNFDMLNKIDFKSITKLYTEANNRLSIINTKEALENKVDTSSLLKIALEDVIFAFRKIKHEELVLSDQLKSILQKTRESLVGNFDHKDPEFVSLKDELSRIFESKNLNEVTKEEMNQNISSLNIIYSKSKELERKNQLISAKYNNDEKYARLHKRLTEKNPLTDDENKLFEALKNLKIEADNQILQNSAILENENYASAMISRLIVNEFNNKNDFNIDENQTNYINSLIIREYTNEYLGKNL